MSGGAQTGWLDRALQASGPGTFRSVTVGGLLPRSRAGANGSVSFGSLADLTVSGAGEGVWPERTNAAIAARYTGVDDPIAPQAAALAIDVVRTAAG